MKNEKMFRVAGRAVALFTLAGLAVGCVPERVPAEELPPTVEPQSEVQTNRTPLSPVVRRNLGITFARAEYRNVVSTVMVPGHFELLTSAQHHYPMPAAGRVTIHAQPLQPVKRGQLLLEVDAPAWRELQAELVAMQTTRQEASAKLTKARAAKAAAAGLVAAGPSSVDVFTAEVHAAEAGLAATELRLEQLVAQASTLTGVPKNRLHATDGGRPYWWRLERIPVRAVDDGVVREVDAASGTWVGEGTEVVHVVHPSALRFRGRALQADLVDHLRDGQAANIVPPEGRGKARRVAPVPGRIRIGVTGDPDTRTVDVFVDLDEKKLQSWIRPQVAALAEVAVDGDPDLEELAIPRRAVIRDGLDTVFFRRDPKDPDAVIRTLADLGPDDGRWVTVYSGLGEGDEVVVDGVYQLKLATTGRKVKAGHFHADGTFHEGDH